MRRASLLTCSALFSAWTILSPIASIPARAATSTDTVVIQPRANSAVAPYVIDPSLEPQLSNAQLATLLRKKVKYVFVLFQENRSFDSYFGTFPGANGLFSNNGKRVDTSKLPGFNQQVLDYVTGAPITISPYHIGPQAPIYSADTDDVDHGHVRMAQKMDVDASGNAAMDQFALVEQQKYTPAGGAPTKQSEQMGELTMAYEDCDTIPFYWNYASRFVLFDNIFQTTIGPSTPNAIAMFAGQTGETQWVKHPAEAMADSGVNSTAGVPVVGDPDPLWGSKLDVSGTTTTCTTVPAPNNAGNTPPPGAPSGQPAGSPTCTPQINLTFASLALTFAGGELYTLIAQDKSPSTNLADVQADIEEIVGLNRVRTPWGWYEEGYNHEPTDPGSTPTHSAYIAHHNGPQYFGYVSDNPEMSSNLHGLNDFFADMTYRNLPDHGVFYVRGGYQNQAHLTPADPDPKVQANFLGDDDHPGYSDSNLSEALVAREVNAIANSPYWKDSAIIITYDESEGDYDHVAPPIIKYDPSGVPLGHGPRIPLIVISPFARVHAVVKEAGDHNSVIKLINTIFKLPALGSLPDESSSRVIGSMSYFTGYQPYLGPEDDGEVPDISDLTAAFSPSRLLGLVPALPASYVTLPTQVVNAVPPYGGNGCTAIGVVPEDKHFGIVTTLPPYFNPRPLTNPN
jgi:phospholipase C